MEARDRKPHILFISHEAGRSGAPLVLLHLLRWMKAHSSVTFEIICVTGGPLVRDFASLAPVTVLDRAWTRWLLDADRAAGYGARVFDYWSLRVLAKITRRFRRWALRRRVGDLTRFSLIYANSAISASCFDALPHRRPPLITHVHELSHSLRHLIPKTSLTQMLELTDCYVGTDAVRDVLVSEHSVPKDRVRVVHYSINSNGFADIADRYVRSDVLAELNIPEDALVVGACGSREWRKGTDLFGQVAASVCARLPSAKVYFVWVGGLRPGTSDAGFCHDFDKLGISDRIRLVDAVSDPYRYFSVFDILAVTSREDSGPLVALEASAMHIPVVGFDSGGLKEMLPEGHARVVGYANIDAMTANMIELLDDPVLRKEIGSNAAEWVSVHHNINLTSSAILDIIGEVTASDRAG